jgi:hypothetical protein
MSLSTVDRLLAQLHGVIGEARLVSIQDPRWGLLDGSQTARGQDRHVYPGPTAPGANRQLTGHKRRGARQSVMNGEAGRIGVRESEIPTSRV